MPTFPPLTPLELPTLPDMDMVAGEEPTLTWQGWGNKPSGGTEPGKSAFLGGAAQAWRREAMGGWGVCRTDFHFTK